MRRCEATKPGRSAGVRGPIRKLLVSAALLLFLALLFLAPTIPAAAHATLVETEPVDGARLDEAPTKVSVTFDEPVDLPVAAIRVFDSAGDRVDAGDARLGADPERMEVDLAGDPGDGTYVVTWQAISLDGHPVRGAFVFQVGDGVADESVLESILGSDQSAPWAAAGAVARWISYGGSLVAAGAAVFQAFVLGSRADRRIIRTIRWAAWATAGASLLQIPFFAGEAAGLGAGALASPQALSDALASPVGRSAVMRIGSAGLLGWTAAMSPRSWPLLGAGGLVAAELFSGHNLTTNPAVVAWMADLVHVGAAAVWTGGIAALIVSLRGADGDIQVGARTVGRFSTLAAWSVLALVAAGLVLAWLEVRAFHALFGTPYGWTLVFKTAVAAVVLATAAYNNRVIVPALLRTPDEETKTAPAWSKLRRTLAVEAAGLVVVLGATAVLVDMQPAADAAGVLGPYSTYLEFGDGQLNLVVDPNRVGVNQTHAYLLSAEGAPVQVEGEAVLEFRHPARDIAPVTRSPLPAGPGHWIHTGPELAVPGEWEITFRLGEGFDETSATARVVVNR